jgi:hypothetical protein
LVKTDKFPCDKADRAEFIANYTVDPMPVAEALLAHIDAMADERARFRRSLLFSVEMIETPALDLNLDALCID